MGENVIKHNRDIVSPCLIITFVAQSEIATRVVPGVNGKLQATRVVSQPNRLALFVFTPSMLNKHFNTPMQNYCISIDWLQTFNHAATLAEGTYYGEMGTYTVKMETTQTAQFFINIF